jgi:outer membrane lipoprotein LolB
VTGAIRAAPLVLLLAACATPQPRPPETAAPLPAQWQVHGRLAVTVDEEAWHGSFDWREETAWRRLEMAGPLGQGTVRLTEEAAGATLELSADEVVTGRDTESLLREHVGWTLPVGGLRHWIVARSDPDRPAEARHDEAGRLVELRQDGWSVDYDRYRAVEGRLLPHRLSLERPGLRVKLVIDRWSLGPVAGSG